MNLLIIEDKLRMRHIIKNVVCDLADEIAEYEDGADPLALFSKTQPDRVLKDIQMKNTNGLTATRQLLSEYADAKIVIVTNFDNAHFRESARQSGAVDYVLKETLLDIRRILQAQ